MFVAKLADPYERAHCVPTQQGDWTAQGRVYRPFVDTTKTMWKIQPDALYMEKIKKEADSEIPAGSCLNHVNSQYGYYFDGEIYFEFHAQSPSSFVWVNLGQESDAILDRQSIHF